MNVSLFIPCFMDALYPQTGIQVVRVLEKAGCTLHYPMDLTCCGQPAFNSGFWDETRQVARKVLKMFEDSEAVVIASGSCGAMLKVFYLELFKGEKEEAAAKNLSEKTYEFADFLVNKIGMTDFGARFPAKVTYHDGCHGLRELGIKSAPRELLKNVRDLELIEMREAETCCGFGGTFAAKFGSISSAMGEVKCASAVETGADFLVSADSSCLMHIQGLLDRQKNPIRSVHLAHVLCSGEK